MNILGFSKKLDHGSSKMLSTRQRNSIAGLTFSSIRLPFSSVRFARSSPVSRLLPQDGSKLRKWYGALDKLPFDGGVNKLDNEGIEEDGSPEGETEIHDDMFVTDGDNKIGQMVILSLIMKRK